MLLKSHLYSIYSTGASVLLFIYVIAFKNFQDCKPGIILILVNPGWTECDAVLSLGDIFSVMDEVEPLINLKLSWFSNLWLIFRHNNFNSSVIIILIFGVMDKGS